jgi:hypothetical protein
MERSIPETLRPLLWSYDFAKIDPEKHQKTIIVQAINYGTLTDWHWLRARYGRVAVRDVLSSISATEIRPRARRLAGLVFDVDRFNYAPRGTH